LEEYYKNLSALLTLEKSEDQLQYSSIFEFRSAQERRAEGLTWYPVAIRGNEVLKADYLSIELERTTHHDVSHAFRTGIPVFLFSNHNAKEHRIAGTVSYQSGNRVRIVIKQDELPEWSSDGKLGLDVAFDNASYSEMFKALKSAAHFENANVLTGISRARFSKSSSTIESDTLNFSQLEAVKKILSAEELAIVHGPPGTGKTTTLIQAIVELLKNDTKRILLTAPSNAAVDLLAEKLSEKGIKVLRIGNPARVSEHLSSLTLEDKIAKHPSVKEIKKLKNQANEYRNLAHKYKRNFGKSEREQRKALFDEAYKLLKEVDVLQKYIADNVFEQTQVVVATLVGSSNYTLEGLKFDITIIDEAGQALEPACLIPIQKSKKLILAGDHFQLPPTIKSSEAAKSGLEVTLLEKLVESQPEAVVMLDTQYRMNHKIAQYSSEIFYNDSLKAHSSVQNLVLNSTTPPFLFIDTAGCGYEEKSEGTSLSNSEEASFLVNRAEELLKDFSGLSVGIISPYKQQLKFLEEYAMSSESLKSHQLSINTIDSFQGQERDAIFISLTRSNPKGEIGFLADTRRINVAMTRAKKLLVIIGDSATLADSPFYSGLINYSQKIDAYKSAWDYLVIQ
jgi:ATP-dependent RNA/DNA helicase IGHMBP2